METGPTADAGPVTKAKPLHRAIAIFICRGYSYHEISRILSYPVEHIEALVSADWFKTLTSRVGQELGEEEGWKTLLAGATFEAALTLMELRDTASSDATRLKACTEILNRAGSKPVVEDPDAEMARLERELAQAQKDGLLDVR